MGEVMRCTAEENPELFRAIPWSHGTLGMLVGVEIKITPIKPWVRLEYVAFPTSSYACWIAAFTSSSCVSSS
jgi:delta24-sterol reductase